MPNAIILEKISKIYQVPSIYPWRRTKKTKALTDVTITCPEGEITCLLGPNGAGKTTIIKILAGLVLPDSGSIVIQKNSLSEKKKEDKINIGLATPNDRSFYWRLTGRQNLEFYASLHGIKGKQRKGLVSDIISEVNLANEADKPFRLYSAGMRQRLILARALLGNPDILLLDEPTSHIDPLAQEQIHRIIENEFIAKRKTTILLCTHNMTEAQKLADKVILLNNGSVIANGTISSLREKISPNLKLVLDFSAMPENGWETDIPVKIVDQNENKIELIIKEESIIPEVVRAAVIGGGDILSCRQNEESLLEIFTRLTDGVP